MLRAPTFYQTWDLFLCAISPQSDRLWAAQPQRLPADEPHKNITRTLDKYNPNHLKEIMKKGSSIFVYADRELWAKLSFELLSYIILRNLKKWTKQRVKSPLNIPMQLNKNSLSNIFSSQITKVNIERTKDHFTRSRYL